MAPRWLEHPLTKGMPLDSPLTTELRRTIIAGKLFLRRIYDVERMMVPLMNEVAMFATITLRRSDVPAHL